MAIDDKVYGVRSLPSGDLGVKMSTTHRDFLLMLALNGGEIPFNWSLLEERNPQAHAHMRKLFEMGLVSETPLLGTPRHLVRLTDAGRNIVTQIKERQS